MSTTTESHKFDPKRKLVAISTVQNQQRDWVRLYTYVTKMTEKRERRRNTMIENIEGRNVEMGWEPIPRSCPPEFRARIVKYREQRMNQPTTVKHNHIAGTEDEQLDADVRLRLKLASIALL